MKREARREVWEGAGGHEEGEEGIFGAKNIVYHSLMASNFPSTN